MTKKQFVIARRSRHLVVGHTGRRAGDLQDRHFGRSDRLCRHSRSRLARRRRGCGRHAQRQGRRYGPQDRGDHGGQQVRAAGSGDGLSQDDQPDKVDIFLSGCVSAGNFAAAPLWCAPRSRWCCARSCRSSPTK